MGLVDEIVHAVAPDRRSCSRRRARISRCGSCAASGPTSTSATSRRRRSSRSRRCASGCASDTAVAVPEDADRAADGSSTQGHGARPRRRDPRPSRRDQRQPASRSAFQGFTDTPLNDIGRRQAPRAGRVAWPRDGIASLWSSDLSRARETAEIVGAAIGLTPGLDARLREGTGAAGRAACSSTSSAAEPEPLRGLARRRRRRSVPGRRVAAGAAERVVAALDRHHAAGRCRRWSSATAARSG